MARYTVDVENWLIELGFQKNGLGYEYRFKNSEIDLQLSAVLGYNRHFMEVFSVDGVCKTSRTLSQPRTEIPPDCTSKEQVAAIIAFTLRSFSQVLRHYKVELFLVGDANKDLHPMVLQQNERQRIYDSRPHCRIDRDWFGTFRKQLRQLLQDYDVEGSTSAVTVDFDGNLLTFEWGSTKLKLPAEGGPWNSSLVVEAKVLTNFPKRFSMPTVVAEYWEGYFGLGGYRYKVVEQKAESPSFEKIKGTE